MFCAVGKTLFWRLENTNSWQLLVRQRLLQKQRFGIGRLRWPSSLFLHFIYLSRLVALLRSTANRSNSQLNVECAELLHALQKKVAGDGNFEDKGRVAVLVSGRSWALLASNDRDFEQRWDEQNSDVVDSEFKTMAILLFSHRLPYCFVLAFLFCIWSGIFFVSGSLQATVPWKQSRLSSLADLGSNTRFGCDRWRIQLLGWQCYWQEVCGSLSRLPSAWHTGCQHTALELCWSAGSSAE